MDPALAKKSIFSHELQNLYTCFEIMLKEPNFPMRLELKKCLPKSIREYVQDINMQTFVSPPASPSRQKAKSISGGGRKSS